MHRTTTLLTTVQRDWPLLRRLCLLAHAAPPSWAIAAAQRQASWLTPGERTRYQADCPALLAQLGMLRRQWRGTVLLAMLLAVAVVARASQASLDVYGIAIFGLTMYAILLPALIFQFGITYDFMAALALQQALRVTPPAPAPDQHVGGKLVPSRVFVVPQSIAQRRKAEHAEQEIERQD